MKVILDTNFLVYMLEKKISVDLLFEFIGARNAYIFLNTYAEIGKIDKKYLKILKLLIDSGKLKMIKKQGKIDELIVSEVKKDPKKTIVCTNDKELGTRIKTLGGKVIVVSKGYFKEV